MSNLQWFRLYHRVIDDEKIRLLAFEDRWHFVALMCLKADGLLDDEESSLKQRKIAVKLGVQARELDEIKRRLFEVGLVDENMSPMAWDELQYRSDSSTDRVRKYREKTKRNRNETSCNVTVTPQDTDTDTDITSSLRSEVKARAPEKASAQSELMKVLDQDHAKAVIDHRKALKKPLTPHAAKLLAAQFFKCPDPNAAADAMIENCWQGFKPEWLQNRQQAAQQRASPASRKLTHTDIWADALREEGILPNEPVSHSTDILDEGYGNRHQESNVHPLRIASSGRY
ncbi:hypothetical protein [Pseudochrobactrum asaccharolyticum]|uniref:Uncharacterized protein n=1 Tax=Pseudochrobactrum asaccharolyticum TaxID=354351 RepID=A0A366DLU0_9HYPH|nr:hypothetical protein [Pseudochrobactrum asaccharolyticum]RBO91053.1 hypothetical protein DFR47_11050 [Pseudochrobactrum asaccharolyticum]